MVGLLFPSNDATPAVRRPVFEVSFGGGSSDSAIGGLASAASSALGVDLGGSSDPWKESVVAIALSSTLAPGVDVAEIYLSANDQAPTVALGDTGTISLGYGDGSAELVFTGQIEQIRHGIDGMTRLTVTNAAAQLAKQRINQSYEQQTAGDIIRDLTSTASVDTDSIEDGITFPFYILDDRRTTYHHIANLAQKSGYLAYITPENKLNFTPFNADQPVQTFTYGTDVLSLTVTESTPGISRVTTIGEGAAGSQGQSAWNWLIKDPSAVQGSSGDGDPNRELPDASLRSQDAAQQAADGKAIAANQLTHTGLLLVPGAPLVVVGSAIEVTDAPQDVLNGLFLVRTIRHRFSKRDGFTTQIGFSKAGDSSSGGLGSLGGLL